MHRACRGTLRGKKNSTCKGLETGWSSCTKRFNLWSSGYQDGSNDGRRVIKAMATLPEHFYILGTVPGT